MYSGKSNRKLVILMLLLLSSAFFVCHASASDEEQKNVIYAQNKFIDDYNKNLTNNGASSLVNSQDIQIEELTTEEMWEKLRSQLFRVEGNVNIPSQTFLLKDNTIISVGNGFGGSGIVSFCICDLNEDGRDELVYTFIFGSGISRCQAGIWMGGPEIISNEFRYLGKLLVEKRDDGHVILKDAAYPNDEGTIANLRLVNREDKPKLIVEIKTNLPDKITKKIW